MRTLRCLAAIAWLSWIGGAGLGWAQSQPPAQAEAAAVWAVEVLGGIATAGPDDFNAFSRYRQLTYVDYYDRLHEYYRSVYGTSMFSGSTALDGRFPVIDKGDSVAVRLTRRISGRVTALVSFDYIGQALSGDVKRTISATTYNPNATSFVTTDTTTYAFSNRRSVRSLSPMAGARAQVVRWRSLSVEAQAMAGVAWGRGRIEEDRTASTTFYRQSSISTMRMSGTGRALNAEASARVAWRAWKGLSIVAEAGYQRLRFKTLTGSLATTVSTRDGDATSVEKETTGSGSGQWGMQPYRANYTWGVMSQPYPFIGGTGNPSAALDLSGARLRVGAAIRF